MQARTVNESVFIAGDVLLCILPASIEPVLQAVGIPPCLTNTTTLHQYFPDLQYVLCGGSVYREISQYN